MQNEINIPIHIQIDVKFGHTESTQTNLRRKQKIVTGVSESQQTNACNADKMHSCDASNLIFFHNFQDI